MLSFCDRTGFPVVALPSLGFDVQLLPVTKVQFEMFMAEPNEFNDSWYSGVLDVNPRVSHLCATDENREQLFLTGILPAEADTFAKWLGSGWCLPTMDLWRRIRALLEVTICRPCIERMQTETLAPAAAGILRCLIAMVAPRNMAQFSMMASGVLEWVRDGESYGGLGSPRLSFAKLFCDPSYGDPVRSLRPGMRLHSFGFRLVRAHGSYTEGRNSDSRPLGVRRSSYAR